MDHTPETIVEGLKDGGVAQEVPTLPPRQAEPQPQSILSPLGQQRYAMMQEVNQTIAGMVSGRMVEANSGLIAQLRAISASLARLISLELGAQND